MKVSEVLQLDLRKKENKRLLLEVLKELPFFKNIETSYILMEDLENAMFKMSFKYPVEISYIMSGPKNPDEHYYSFMIKNSDTHEWIKTVYGKTIFEGYAKAVFFVYHYIQNVLKKEK